MVSSPWYYPMLVLVTLVLLLAKDQLVFACFKSTRPSKAISSPTYYMGYAAVHFVFTLLLLRVMESIWQSAYNQPLVHYALLVGAMEAMIRWGCYIFLSPAAGALAIPGPARLISNYNYVIVSWACPTLLYALERLND